MVNINPSSLYIVESRILRLDGSSFRPLFRILIEVTKWFLALAIWFPMTIELYIKRRHLTESVDILCYFLTVTAYLVKLFCFTRNSHLLTAAENILHGHSFTDHDIHQDRHLVDAAKTMSILEIMYLLQCSMVFLGFCILSILGEGIPVNVYLVVDVKEYYIQVTAFEVITIGVCAICNISLDLMCWCLVLLGSCQLAIFAERVKKALELKKEGEVMEGLKRCVIHHNEIIRYLKLIEETFGMGIFAQFFSSVLVICVTGFQLTIMDTNSSIFMTFCIYFVVMMFQVSLYCAFGNGVIYTSSTLNSKFYMSNWYEHGPSVRKMLIVMMERAKRPLSLKAGNMLPLNYTTLVSILHSSYSYFAVLRRIYNKQ